MNPRLFQQIATKLNRDDRRHNGVTAEQVANVASGTERTVSSSNAHFRDAPLSRLRQFGARAWIFLCVQSMKINPQVMAQFPREHGKRVSKPHWWFALISESELHSRIKEIADKRAKELACFGGK